MKSLRNETQPLKSSEIQRPQISPALQRVLSEPSTAQMAAKDFAGATISLPTKFRDVWNFPKLSDQIKAIGEPLVIAMMQFQLGLLASRVTTGGNLDGGMVEFIARQLVEMHPTESMADFKLCFERGAMGRYGKIQRMDGLTVS